ncbi:gamma-secretase-activating protein-like [Diadema antillarum]|uniref:gamma-secretase-activating protein-like n=1 Tax=Diadema antillarum TaxID=105358 RepID=UPI003A872F79
MDFECTFDITKDILPFVLSQRDEAIKEAGQDIDVAETLRVVGQERNGAILYTWDDLAQVGDNHVEVTHVGIYEPAEQKNRCLFVHDCKIPLVSCSINWEHSVLAYVSKETRPAPARTGDDALSITSVSEQQDVYRAFLAEIQPQHAIFDLNLERTSLLHVQFLWPRSGQGPTDVTATTSKDSRLLVFLHSESIGLYRVPLARIGNNRMISGPPDAQPVVSRFLWAQWDAPTQRLFVVLPRTRTANEPELPAVFRCFEFLGQGSQTTFTKMMEMDLPPDIKWPSSRSTSYELPSLRNTVSVRAINMYVVCQPGGSVCLCYQLPVKRLANSKPSSRRQSRGKLMPQHSGQSDPGGVSRGRGDEEWGRRPQNLNLNSRESSATSLSPEGPTAGKLLTPTSPATDSSLNLSQDSSTGPLTSPAYWSALSSPATPDFPGGMRRSLTDQLDAAVLRSLVGDMPGRSRSGEQHVDVHYVVLVLHHRIILQCSVPHVPRTIAKRMLIHFAPLNGYIMAYYPGTMLHLLNVGPEVEPCLHLAFEQQDVPWIPQAGAEDWEVENGENGELFLGSREEQLRTCRPLLSHCLRDRTASKYDDVLFDSRTGRCYNPFISKDKLPSLLVRDSLIPFKLGLLHLAIINLKDAALNKKIIECITKDPFQLEMEDILAECLLASTFGSVRLKLERNILLYFPFTKTDTSKTFVIETLDGRRLACFKAVQNRHIPKIFLTKRGRREKRFGSDPASYLWEALDAHVKKSQELVRSPIKRFDTRSILQKLREQDTGNQVTKIDEKETLPLHPPATRSSLLKKVAAFSKRALSPSKDPRQAKSRDPLAAVMMEEDARQASGMDTNQNKHLEMILSDLVSFLRSNMPFHTQERLVNYASEYVGCQLQQMKHMITLLMAANGFTEDMDELAKVSLNQPASEKEQSLFSVIERLFSAAQHLCFPQPPGFKNFFLSLAFRCLDRTMFLQYVSQGVLELNEAFLIQLIEEMTDEDRANVDLKFKLLHKIPKASAERVLLQWDHPKSNLIKAQHYTSSCLQEGAESRQKNLTASAVTQTRSHRSRKKSSEAAIVGQEVYEDFFQAIPDFPPLTYFMKVIEGADQAWQTPAKGRSELQQALNSQFVGRVALQSSVKEHGLDLGGIAF